MRWTRLCWTKFVRHTEQLEIFIWNLAFEVWIRSIWSALEVSSWNLNFTSRESRQEPERNKKRNKRMLIKSDFDWANLLALAGEVARIFWSRINAAVKLVVGYRGFPSINCSFYAIGVVCNIEDLDSTEIIPGTWPEGRRVKVFRKTFSHSKGRIFPFRGSKFLLSLTGKFPHWKYQFDLSALWASEEAQLLVVNQGSLIKTFYRRRTFISWALELITVLWKRQQNCRLTKRLRIENPGVRDID